MKIVNTVIVMAMLFIGLISGMGSLATVLDYPSGTTDTLAGQSHGGLNHLALRDPVPHSHENYGYTEPPGRQPLEIVASDIPGYDYMAVSPYYKVFFKGTTVKMVIGDAWIAFQLPEQGLGKIESEVPSTDKNSLSVSNIYDSVDLSYKVDTSLLTETLTLRESKEFDRVIQEVSWGGMEPEFKEDGSILFLKEEKEILKILPPFMEDAKKMVCYDVYYNLIETEEGYELHKVIGENGLKWLKEAVYPVIIDPSMQTMEDAWESSGLTPYGFINPATGRLTVTQTDLVIPGRGLDLVISRIYETPAVFYGSSPYDYETPPVDVGKGWQLDFPYVGSKYLHLFGGGIYKIEWSGSIFENHKDTHFILVKNGDYTYTLTTADGMVCEFDTSGKLTQIKDVDQNTVSFTYSSGILTTITDTIGRTVSLTYVSNRLWKVTYNGEDIEYSYDANGCLVSMEDFLNRETNYYYNSGYNYWLLSKIVYKMGGYTMYTYDRFSDSDYYKYHVTDQKVYETDQVQHIECSYTGSFEAITASSMTVENESNVVQGSNNFTMNSGGLITEIVINNASSSPIRKYTYTYSSQNKVTQKNVYYDGVNLSYTNYYGYDNWGNLIYIKNADGHERFLSYANTSTSGFFIDNTGTIIKTFTNSFSNSTVPSTVHNALLGMAEKQDTTYVKEVYVTYNSEAHPTQMKTSFGNTTTWLTFSGTFNESTGATSFPVDLTGHTLIGNAVLQITGLASDPTYSETHSYTPGYGTACSNANWTSCYWQSNKYKTFYTYTCGVFPDVLIYQSWVYIGPFTHYPGTLGYQSYTTNPSCNQKAYSFTVTTYWKAYPAQVQYGFNGSNWNPVSSNLANTTAKIAASGLTDGQNTLYFSESSSQQTKFSWYLYVPVDNTPDTYITTAQYDTYGNITSVTDPESNTATLTYSSNYSHAYLTEISRIVGQDTVTLKATYDYNRGWITSIQQPKGVEAGTGFDILYTYDVMGRVTKMEYPLLQGQSERSHTEIVYDCETRTVTLIDQLGHYAVQQYDKLGRLTDIKLYTGTYSSGTLYATTSWTYRYDNLVSTVTDPGNHTITYTYDFFGRSIHIQFPDLSTVSYSYDDTNNKVTLTSGRGYDRIYWLNWVGRLIKVEEEYYTDLFAVTTYQYDEIGHLTSFTDAENHTTNYTYASFYGLKKTTYPDSEYEEYEYDDIGNLISFTDANGNETMYTYDSLRRLTEIEYEDQSTVSFTYDLNSNRTRMDDDAPSIGNYVEYTYDEWNRLITETRHIDQDTYAVSYQYDGANRLTKLTYPDDMQILYSYDDLDRLTEIRRYVDGSNDEILMDNIQYNTESLLTQFDYGNDLRATFAYDSSHRVLTHDIKDGETSYLDLDYTWDNNSNITQLINGWRDTNFDWHSDTESYSYDGVDRLTSASCTSWSHTYAYDKVGNRTAKDGVTYTVNTLNQVTGLSDGTSFTYDPNGNMTGKTKGSDTWDYTYDYLNRLIEVEKNDTTMGEYVYDGDGQRMKVTEDNKTTLYIYSGLNVLYEETTAGTATYVYGSNGRLAKRTTIQSETHTFYYHADHLKSTRLITDESADVVVVGTYEPFGESTVTGEESYLFTGKKMDKTGLYYFNARYYDPDLGRFITRDPLAGEETNPQSLNLYTYCVNNPLKLTDPTGLFYKMCLENGNCLWVWENGPKRGQWIAKDAEGNTITDSEQIDSLLNAGQILEAMVLVLQFFGFDVDMDDIHYSNSWKDENGNVDYEKIKDHMGGERSLGYIEFEQDGKTIRIDVKIFGGFFGSSGHISWDQENNKITMTFYLANKINANEFLHIVGHECIHLNQYLTGQYTEWINIYGPAGAQAMAEVAAYHWNVRLDFFGVTYQHTIWVSSLEHHQKMYKRWLTIFFKRIK